MVRITDSADRPNPGAAQLPDYHHGLRRPDTPRAPLDLRLVALAVLALALPCGVVLWIVTPALVAWRNLALETMAIYADALRVVMLLVMLLGLAGIVAAVWRAGAVLGALGARARVVRLENDRPVDVSDLRRPDWVIEAARATELHYQVQGRWADNSGLRGTTFAPHYSNRQDVQTLPGPEPAAAPLALPGPVDMAALGFTPTPETILLGVDESGPVTASARALWHIATAGPTGNGKSNAHRLLMAQLLKLGARMAVGDPKWTPYDAAQDEDWRPIERRLAMAPAVKAPEIASLLSWSAGELEKRLEARRAGRDAGKPFFIVLDELPWIYEHVKGADKAVGELVRLGRGVNFFVMAAAQDWLGRSVGITSARDNFRTALYLGGDLHTGSVLLDIPRRELAELEGQLGVGLAVLRSAATKPPRIVRVPYMSNAALYSLLGDAPAAPASQAPILSPAEAPSAPPFGFRPAPAMPSAMPSGKTPGSLAEDNGKASAEMPSTAAGSGAPTPEEARIIALFLAGRTVGEIIKEVYGPNGGRRYNELSDKVHEIVRRALAAKGGA